MNIHICKDSKNIMRKRKVEMLTLFLSGEGYETVLERELLAIPLLISGPVQVRPCLEQILFPKQNWYCNKKIEKTNK